MSLAEIITRGIELFYIAPVAKILSRQTFRYAVCGGLNYFVLDPLYYFLIYHFVVARRFIDLGFVLLSPHVAALILVFPITFFNGFWLNRHVTFNNSSLRSRTQLMRYALSVAGSVVLTYVGLKFFVEVCAIWPTPAKVLTTLLTTVYSFLAAKYFSFRATEKRR